MKLTTLGCWGAYPYQDEGTTAYLLTGENGFHLLVDQGSLPLMNSGKEISPLNWCGHCFPHYHPDHVADLGVLRHYFSTLSQASWKPKASADLWTWRRSQNSVNWLFEGCRKVLRMMLVKVSKLVPLTLLLWKQFTQCPAMLFVSLSVRQDRSLLSQVIRVIWWLMNFTYSADLFLADVYLYEGNENHIAHLTSKEAGRLPVRQGLAD